jgi:hypothetical protein
MIVKPTVDEIREVMDIMRRDGFSKVKYPDIYRDLIDAVVRARQSKRDA